MRNRQCFERLVWIALLCAVALPTPAVAVSVDEDVVDKVVAEVEGVAKVSEPAQLSVPPLDHMEYPADRPGWITDAPLQTPETPFWTVVTPPCETAEEADEVLAVLTRAAVDAYVLQSTGVSREDLGLTLDDSAIEKEFVDKRYEGTVKQGDSTLLEYAVRLKFSPKFDTKIAQRAREVEVGKRLGAAGVCITGLFGMLAVCSGVVGTLGRRIERRQTLACDKASLEKASLEKA